MRLGLAPWQETVRFVECHGSTVLRKQLMLLDSDSIMISVIAGLMK